MLLIGTRSAHQVLCGGLLSHGEDEAAVLNREHKYLSWIFIKPPFFWALESIYKSLIIYFLISGTF